jgi:hypothetical protein
MQFEGCMDLMICLDCKHRFKHFYNGCKPLERLYVYCPQCKSLMTVGAEAYDENEEEFRESMVGKQ